MSRIYGKIKSLLSKDSSSGNNNTDKQNNRSEELEAICKSKSLLQKTQNSVKEIWLLCMEPFV